MGPAAINDEVKRSIVVLMADQLGAVSLDEAHVEAPWLRATSGRGLVYSQAYCSFPLCTPSRSSMITGRMPHELGVMGNDQHSNPVGRDPHSLGHWFRSHGYRTAWAGKYHAPDPDCDPEAGFEVIHPFGDAGLLESVHAWLARASRSEPFLLIASWDDPHSICEYARNQPMPYGDVSARDVRDCPPLPPNFYTPLPEALRQHRAATPQMYGTDSYSEERWRQYRDVYAQLIARLDRQWSHLGTRLEELGVTLVITSDHGDGDAAHAWNQKTALSQESIKVPLVVAGPHIAAEQRDHPVNMSTGLLASLSALAGIPAPPGVRDWSSGEPVVVQTRFQTGTGWTQGRSLIVGTYKYVVYSWGTDREQLFNLKDDPHEMRNLALESQWDEQLEQCREALFRWCERNRDEWMLRKLVWPRSAQDRCAEIFDPPY